MKVCGSTSPTCLRADFTCEHPKSKTLHTELELKYLSRNSSRINFFEKLIIWFSPNYSVYTEYAVFNPTNWGLEYSVFFVKFQLFYYDAIFCIYGIFTEYSVFLFLHKYGIWKILPFAGPCPKANWQSSHQCARTRWCILGSISPTFYKHFCVPWSQKHKKTMMTWLSFYPFGIFS